jgi:hypothetical protein
MFSFFAIAGDISPNTAVVNKSKVEIQKSK